MEEQNKFECLFFGEGMESKSHFAGPPALPFRGPRPLYNVTGRAEVEAGGWLDVPTFVDGNDPPPSPLRPLG